MTVICKICNKEFKIITQLHLRKHKTNVKKYMSEFKDAYIREAFDCGVCGKQVLDAVSARTKYCSVCSKDMGKKTVLSNVRKYNRKKKLLREKLISEANKEHGIILDNPNSNYRTTRIDSTHTGWDFIAGVLNNIGTITENDLKVNKNGRVKGMVKLERQIRLIREKQKRKLR